MSLNDIITIFILKLFNPSFWNAIIALKLYNMIKKIFLYIFIELDQDSLLQNSYTSMYYSHSGGSV